MRCFVVRLWLRLDSNRALHSFLSITIENTVDIYITLNNQTAIIIMEHTSSDNDEGIAKQIVLHELNNVFADPTIIKQNECAACHILFKLIDKMELSESDASNILSEILFHDPK